MVLDFEKFNVKSLDESIIFEEVDGIPCSSELEHREYCVQLEATNTSRNGPSIECIPTGDWPVVHG